MTLSWAVYTSIRYEWYPDAISDSPLINDSSVTSVGWE
ncbi:MipA/OmpV family protein [Vreelandella olivaria]